MFRKMLSILLSALMLISTTTFAYADEPIQDQSIKTTNAIELASDLRAASWGSWSPWASYTISGGTIGALATAIGTLCPKLVSAAVGFASYLFSVNVTTCTMKTRTRYRVEGNYQYYEMQVSFYSNGKLVLGPETVTGKASLDSIIKSMGDVAI